jgi:hypothetical protein
VIVYAVVDDAISPGFPLAGSNSRRRRAELRRRAGPHSDEICAVGRPTWQAPKGPTLPLPLPDADRAADLPAATTRTGPSALRDGGAPVASHAPEHPPSGVLLPRAPVTHGVKASRDCERPRASAASYLVLVYAVVDDALSRDFPAYTMLSELHEPADTG